MNDNEIKDNESLSLSISSSPILPQSSSLSPSPTLPQPPSLPSNNPQIGDLEKEIRSLKRKLALAEDTITKAKLISGTQKRAELIFNASLKKELQFFKLVLENTTNILLLFDFDGRFAYASNTFLTNANIANFGLISGRHFRDVLSPIIPGEGLIRFTEAVGLAAAQKSTITLEEQIDFNFKGSPRLFSILVTPMTDEDGNNSGIMALFNDITAINNALKEATRANLAKSNFLANMSHEIRTPLNAIIGMSAIAQDSTDVEKIHFCLDKISDSSKHLLGIINDILDMSKIESNHFELSFYEFAFEKMILRVIDMMRFKIDEKNITFSLYCDTKIPYIIYSDEQRLSQVIMNLLSNALKFTPKFGRVSIRAEVESFIDDDYILRFTVEDTGIGISPEQKPRLFKAFSQADSNISRKFGGTGLGLVISKNIINMLDGDIWFDSEEGKGTTFTFNIKTRSCQLNPQIKPYYAGLRILVLDGSPDVRLSFSLYAKKLGIDCATTVNMDDAMETLKNQAYNILFADWDILGGDRLSFIRELNVLYRGLMTVIMVQSASSSNIEIAVKNAGARECVAKPVLMPIIENALDKYCENFTCEEIEEYDDFSGLTVLLADDVEINREIIISLLEPTNINIICAGDGKEALEVFAGNMHALDLIFMDVHMPEMDGYEATRLIRAMEVGAERHTPIVAMTANVFKEDVERCLASGMNDHIGKPIDVDDIFKKIRYWTSRRL